PSIEIGYLSTNANDIDVAAAEGFEAIHLLSVLGNTRTVRRAHDAGVRVNVWTVNRADDIEKALAAGVDGVITDEAALAIATRGAFCESYVCPGADAGAGMAPPSGGCGVGGGGSAPFATLLIVGALFALRR